ncbi:MAG: haloacid dehalogenase-like hydrolase [Alphaproteobacteria bacterium]|nr:haloacid dehalogenase-like hydrolase [Alphaproteobacteria bacterium]
MTEHKVKMAICYDFDGTLAPGNMQEYGFIESIGKEPQDFWNTVNSLAKNQGMDGISCCMYFMLKEAKYRDIAIKREDFNKLGKNITLFKGVDKWFSRIKKYADSKDITLTHYIISSGLKEIIEGSSIAKEIDRIYGSKFMYDANGIAIWPGISLNFTSKTQYISRINKGFLDETDTESVNDYVDPKERKIPYENIIYIGDGLTDIPSMSAVKKNNGHSIAVYDPNKPNATEVIDKLVKDKRIHFYSEADYSENSALDKYVKAVIDKVNADNRLHDLEIL